MENFNPSNSNKPETNNEQAKLGPFLSNENATRFLGKASTILGGAFVLAGIYEFFSGEKVAHLVESYKDQLPDMVNACIDSMDKMPLIIKTGGGGALMSTGRWLREVANNKNK